MNYMYKDRAALGGAIQNLSPILATSLTTVLNIFGLSVNPALSILFTSAYGLFGYYLFHQQERLNDFANWIKNHPDKFTDYLIQQPAFQQGFFPTLETYLRVRSEEKVKLVQQVFLGFADSDDKAKFELERFYEVIKMMSVSQIDSLHIFKDSKYIKLLEEGEDRSENFYHDNYQTIRSLEALGIVILHTDIEVAIRSTYSGDPESGHSLDGGSEAVPKKSETVELTNFGRDLLLYLE